MIEKPIYAAILCAAFFLTGFAPATAQEPAHDQTPTQSATDVVIAKGGSLITGQMLGFDGTYIRLMTEAGEITLDGRDTICEGPGCPDPDHYVPSLRLSGAERMAEVLLPALIDGYARAQGMRATRRDIGDDRFEYDLDQTDTGLPVLRFAFHVGSSSAGFQDLIHGRADAALSVREARPDEVLAALDAGLGRLSDARRSEIVALDALIPIGSARRPRQAISLTELTRIYAGEITDWIELGEAPGPINLHLLTPESGQTQGFTDSVMRSADMGLSPTITYHDTTDSLLRAVTNDANSLGLTGFASFGLARALDLNGSCGLSSTATLLSLKTEDYPLTRPMFIYFPERRLPPEAQDWLEWLRSPDAQRIIRRAGFVDRGPVPVPLAGQGARLSQAILIADRDVPLSDIQDMVTKMQGRERLTTTFRFTPGSTRLDAQSRSNMLQLGRALRDGAFNGKRLYLIGFSDGQGPHGPNRTLSLARAESVRRALLSAMDGRLPDGVTLEIDAFGEALPMACDDTPWGRQTNRRVELWLADD